MGADLQELFSSHWAKPKKHNTILENKDNKVGYGGEMEGNMFEEFKIELFVIEWL